MPDSRNIFLSSSDELVPLQNWGCVTMIFTQNSSIFHWALHQPINFFYSFEVSRGSSNWSLKNYGFICNVIFFFTCTHAHKALSNEMYLLLKITKIEIPSVGMETGMPIYIVDSVFELMPNQWFFNTAYISLLCVKWQTSAEACTCC